MKNTYRDLIEQTFYFPQEGFEVIDNQLHFSARPAVDSRQITWRRVLDMNDRALREITSSLGGVSNGFPRVDGFDIVVASEVMAIFCLATDLKDLQRRLANIVIGQTRDKKSITAKEKISLWDRKCI